MTAILSITAGFACLLAGGILAMLLLAHIETFLGCWLLLCCFGSVYLAISEIKTLGSE